MTPLTLDVVHLRTLLTRTMFFLLLLGGLTLSSPALGITLSTTKTAALTTTPQNMVRYTVGENEYLAVAAGADGLMMYQITADAISLVGQYDTTGTAFDVAVDGTFAYVADGNTTQNFSSKGHLLILNIADPANPLLVGDFFTSLGVFRAVEVKNGILYGADFVNGLKAVNITDPAAPVELGTYAEGIAATDLYVSSTGYAYLLQQAGGAISVVNVANPAAMTLAGSWFASTTANELEGLAAESPDLIFLSNGEDGLSVIDFSVPSTPAVVGTTYNTAGSVNSLSLLEELPQHGLLADGSGGVQVINMTDPNAVTALVASTAVELEDAIDTAVIGEDLYILTTSALYELSLDFAFAVEGTKNGEKEGFTVTEGGSEWCSADISDKEIGAKVFLADIDGDGLAQEIVEMPIGATKKPKVRLYDVSTCALLSEKKLNDTDKKLQYVLQVGNYYADNTAVEIVAGRVFQKDEGYKLELISLFGTTEKKLSQKAIKKFVTKKKFFKEGFKIQIKEGKSYPVIIKAKESTDVTAKYALKKKDGEFTWKQKEE